jgi:hypothetical protein
MTIEQNINDLLARFSACTTYAEYVPLRSLCVQALDSYETDVGVGPNRYGQWVEFERIDAEKRLMVRAEYRAIPTLSLDELVAATAPVNLLTALRARIDADNAATNGMLAQIAVIHADTAAMQAVMFPAVREGSEHQMGVAAE